MNKTMSTKSIFTFQIIAGALLLSLLVFGCSGSDSEKTPIPLEGLWAITDTQTITMPEEKEPAVELKNGENEQIGETEESTRELEDGTYLDLKGTTYSCFSRSEGVKQDLSNGTYLRKGSELTFISASEDTITAEILELSAALLKLEIRIGEDLQEWTLERIQLSTLPEEEEEEEESEFVDYEALYHDAQALKGSILNPYPLAESLNDTLQGILSYGEEESNPPVAEYFYFLKVDPKDSYRLTLSVAEPVYNYEKLPAAFMRYVQLWVGSQPFEDYFKADSRRINEGQGEPFPYEGLMSTTGFLYLRIFSLQDGIHYNMVLEKEDPAEEEQTNEEE